MSMPGTSFADVEHSISHPRIEQAIVIELIDGVQIEEYANAIGNLIGRTEILCIGTTLKNEICMYVKSKELVDKLVDTQIEIKNTKLSINPLISRNKRIIISNVHPFIPNEEIVRVLKTEYNVEPVSEITALRSELDKQKYVNCLGFCREIIIKPDDLNKLPEYIKVYFDGLTNRIFLKPDSKALLSSRTQSNMGPQPAATKTSHTTQPLPISTKNNPILHNKQKNTTRKTNGNRQRPLDLSEIEKEIQSYPSKYTLNFSQFESFLALAYKSENLLKVVKMFTDDPSKLIEMINELYPIVNNGRVKNRFTRLLKKMKIAMEGVDAESSHESSASESSTDL